MKSNLLYLIATLAVSVGCGEHEQVKARIFERKELEGSRLMIKYQYRLNEKVYTDSATLANNVINSDSIFVIIDPSNPGKSLPDIHR